MVFTVITDSMEGGDCSHTGFIGCSKNRISQFVAAGFSGHYVETRFDCGQKFLAIVRWPVFDQSFGGLLGSANDQPPAGVLEYQDDLIKFRRGVEFHYTVPTAIRLTNPFRLRKLSMRTQSVA